MWRIIGDFESRLRDNDEARRSWDRFADHHGVIGAVAGTETEEWAKDDPRHRWVVMANALALIYFPTHRDMERLADLIDYHGGLAVAQMQETALAHVDEPHRPLTTQLVRMLGRYAWSGPNPPLAPVGDTELEEMASNAVAWLFMCGEMADDPPSVESPDQLVELLHGSGILEWRAAATRVLADPWDGTLDRYEAMLDAGVHEADIKGLRSIAGVGRRLAEEQERHAVAARIRQALDESGLSQREFAARVGTSSSRLSTYANGSVTPSAAMLLRINRVARLAGVRRDAGSIDSWETAGG